MEIVDQLGARDLSLATRPKAAMPFLPTAPLCVGADVDYDVPPRGLLAGLCGVDALVDVALH
jgi:hypothetical protein